MLDDETINRLADAVVARLCGNAGDDSNAFGDRIAAAVAEKLSELLGPPDWPHGLLTVDERQAAALLGISQSVLYRERVAGRIGYSPVGKRVRYCRANVLDYMKRHGVSPEGETEDK